MEKELPSWWEKCKLEECAHILDNLRQPVNASERAKREGKIPYYGATGQAGWIDDFLFDEELILVGEDGAPFFDKQKNVAYKIEGKSWVNNHAHALKAKDEITINSFLLHYLNYFDYTDFVGGTTRLKLTQGSLREIPFPLPPFAEQKRIVAKLDAAFAHLYKIKANLERIPERLKSFRRAILIQAVTGKLTKEWRINQLKKDRAAELQKVETFTGIKITQAKADENNWLEFELGEISTRVSVGHVGETSKYYTDADKGIIFLRSQNVRPGKLNLDGVAFITREFHQSLKKSQLKAGDLLIVRVGANRGDATILPEGFNEINCANIVFARPYPEYSEYLNIYFQSSLWTNLVDELTTGTAQGVINTKIVEKVKINLPSIEEQKEIVKIVKVLLSKADIIEAQHDYLKEKISSIPEATLSKAFRGELVPPSDHDEPASKLLDRIKQLKSNQQDKPKSKTVATSKKGQTIEQDLESIIKDNFKRKAFSFEELLQVTSYSYEELSEKLLGLVSSENENSDLKMSFNKQVNRIEFTFNK